MGILSKLRTLFRGDIPLYHLPHEFIRRRKAESRRSRERAALDELNASAARLLPTFSKYIPESLLDHFRAADRPSYRPPVAMPNIKAADSIADDSTWELMGFGKRRFDGPNVWRRDPISGHDWGTDYHVDLPLVREGGSDIRVLWELNRLGHLPPLATAYEATENEKYAETFFSHIGSWIEQNPYARGANWTCAMEVALRCCNALAAFQAFRRSKALTIDRLGAVLAFFDHHGRYIVDNNEFSFIATSNHYLSDVVGLFWLGTLMPELECAAEWRDLGLRELLREMDKQVLPDGADFESSSGYHRFVTEMFLETFHLAKQNDIEIGEHYWKKLDAMLDFLQAITRPDGKMPLVGDCDGSRFLPFDRQHADDSQFLLELAGRAPMEARSAAFPDAGIYTLRYDDLYLNVNASHSGIRGRGSHGHNDALSIEVFAGRPFIVDPGNYAYNLDLDARHVFRSTAYHSTIAVDCEEQNAIRREMPFIIGNEANPKLLEWSLSDTADRVAAEHYGYQRLKDPVVHRRAVEFVKGGRYWIITDELKGRAAHHVSVRFHLAPGVSIEPRGNVTDVHDSGLHLLIRSNAGTAGPELEDSYFSPNYGERLPTRTLVWKLDERLPLRLTTFLVPADSDNLAERLELIERFTDNS